ncbi:MAG: autorepressor SdpR family transcription factor [Pseudomonadota bacterium]
MTDIYKALAHPVRREILMMLRTRAHTAGEIAEMFSMTKPSLSGHFSVLKDADLVTVERSGTTLIYRINMSVAEDAMAGLMALFRIGEAAPAPLGKGAIAKHKNRV